MPASTPHSCSIRSARPEDAVAIHALIAQLAEYEKLTHLLVNTVDGLRQDLFGPQPVGECVLACQSDRVVGFALFFSTYSTFLGRRGLYLEDLFVLPEVRGQGCGKALLTHLAQLAVDRQYGRFEWSVLDWNQSAIDFYEGMGATVLPDWRICRVTGDALLRMAAAERS